jgi:hypothetical protein
MKIPDLLERALQHVTFPVYELDRRVAGARFIGGIQTGRRATDVEGVECVYVDSGTGRQVLVETVRRPSGEPEEMVARDLYDRVAPDAVSERMTSMSTGTLPVEEWSLECTVFGSPQVWGAVGEVSSGGELRVASVGLALEDVILRVADLSAYTSD